MNTVEDYDSFQDLLWNENSLPYSIIWEFFGWIHSILCCKTYKFLFYESTTIPPIRIPQITKIIATNAFVQWYNFSTKLITALNQFWGDALKKIYAKDPCGILIQINHKMIICTMTIKRFSKKLLKKTVIIRFHGKFNTISETGSKHELISDTVSNGYFRIFMSIGRFQVNGSKVFRKLFLPSFVWNLEFSFLELTSIFVCELSSSSLK